MTFRGLASLLLAPALVGAAWAGDPPPGQDAPAQARGTAPAEVEIPPGEAGAAPARLATGRARGAIHSADLSPDGRLVATGNSDGTATVWEVASGRAARVLAMPRIVGGDQATYVRFSRDGARVAAFCPGIVGPLGLEDSGVTNLWDAADGRLARAFADPGEVRKALQDGTPDAELLWAFCGSRLAPDGRSAWALMQGAFVQLLLPGPRLGRRVEVTGPPERVEAFAFAPSGREVLVGHPDGTIRAWDLRTGAEARRWPGHRGGVVLIRPCADGLRFVSAGEDRAIRVWSLAGGPALAEAATGIPLLTGWVEITPDGRLALIRRYVEGSQELSLWDLEAGREVRAFRPGFALAEFGIDPGGSVVYALRRDLLAFGGAAPEPPRLAAWEARSGRPLATLRGGFVATMKEPAIHPDGKRLATVEDDGPPEAPGVVVVALRALDSGEILERLAIPAEPPSRGLPGLAFSPDGRRLALALDRSCAVWDLDARRVGSRVPGWFDGFSADGARLVTRHLTAALGDPIGWSLRDASDGTSRAEFVPSALFAEHHRGVTAFALSPDGRRLLTGGPEGTARLWDLESGRCLRVLRAHRDLVSAVAFSPDGRQALTGGRDRTARLWDLDTGRHRQAVRLDDAVHSVAFSADGSRLFASDSEGVSLWPAPAR